MAMSTTLTPELMKLCKFTKRNFKVLMVSKSPTINTRVRSCIHLYTPLACLEIKMLQLLIDCSNFCIIDSLTTITVHLKMLRMTHLSHELLVLLVQVSSGSHIVSPYPQPAFLSKPDNKARKQIIQTD